MVELKALIEKRLEELIPNVKENLFQAARYALLAPGKRLRPLLTLSTLESFGEDPLLGLDPACALEMIHTYSLIHDDLPCMDDDDLRRGRPTVHKVYGEAIALLAGDYLLTYAFEILANCSHLPAELKLDLIKILSQKSGSQGMIGGQAIDIESVGKQIDETKLLNMHRGKTGALFAAALQFGGKIASRSRKEIELLEEIGQELGIAYQFSDDLNNATSTSTMIGKTAGSDAAKSKPTAVSFFGLEKTKEKTDELYSAIFTKIERFPRLGNPLINLLRKLSAMTSNT